VFQASLHDERHVLHDVEDFVVGRGIEVWLRLERGGGGVEDVRWTTFFRVTGAT
jgi:hypothetical protein